MRSPLVVGHRGAAAVAPENTLTGFARGVADGADVVELDVHLTADGAVAVIHDATVDRVSTAGRRSGAVAQMTWAQLQQVVLAQEERVPSLREALVAAVVPVQLEVKAVAAALPALQVVRELGCADRVTITSFRPEALRAVREHDREIAVGLIVDRPVPDVPVLLAELDAVSFAVGVEHVDRAAVADLQRAGVVVTAWPVLGSDRLERALRAGVDLVCTDDPAWARQALDARAVAATR